MLMLSMTGKTGWEPLVNIELAKRINLALGGPFVSPWDVGQFDDATIDIVTGMIRDLPSMQKGMGEIEQIKQRIRNAHPTYRKARGRLH